MIQKALLAADGMLLPCISMPGPAEDAAATHEPPTSTDLPAEPDIVVPEAEGDDLAPPSIVDRLVGGAHRLRGWQRGLIAFVLYLIVAVAVWASPILTRFNERYLGDGYWDAKFYQWAVGWMHWSIANHTDPLYTHKLFPPNGTSLAWSAFDPAGGLAMYPIRTLFGSLAATNTLLVLGSALACWGAYLVCHRVTGAFWPALVGGYLFGFSEYMVGQLHGHVNLVLIFPVPIAVYLVVRLVEGSLGRVAFLALMTLTLVTLFLFSTELFATAALFGAVAFVIALVAARTSWRRVLDAGVLTFGAFVASAVVLTPYLVAAVQNERPDAVHDLAAASADAASFVVPRNVTLLTTATTDRWSSMFLAKSVRQGELPLWITHVLGGAPFLANSQSAVFYPPNWLYFVLPVSMAWAVLFIIRTVLAGIFTTVFVRSLGAGPLESLCSGLVFSSAGFMTVWRGYPMGDAAIWLPFVCYGLVRLSRMQTMRSLLIVAIGFSMPDRHKSSRAENEAAAKRFKWAGTE